MTYRKRCALSFHEKFPFVTVHFFVKQTLLRDGPLAFWRGGGMKNPEKNCLQNQKSPNKSFADMKRRK